MAAEDTVVVLTYIHVSLIFIGVILSAATLYVGIWAARTGNAQLIIEFLQMRKKRMLKTPTSKTV